MVVGWAPASRSLSLLSALFSISLFLFPGHTGSSLSLSPTLSLSPPLSLSLSPSLALTVSLCHSIFFSSFSNRSYSREVAPSSHERGVGWKERAIFSPREPGAAHTHIHVRSRGGRSRGDRRGDGSYRTVRHIGGSGALFIGRLHSEKLFSQACVYVSSRSPSIYYTATDQQL